MSKQKTILILASHYSPNIGGVETHLNDLVKALVKRGWKTVVGTYKPLAVNKKVPFYQHEKGLYVYRLPWIGFNIVHKLTPYPLFEFLYLFPGLFFLTPFILLRHQQIKTIHAQGLVPAAVAVIWGKILNKKTIMSTHNLYFFPKEGAYKYFSKLIISLLDLTLGLSVQSENEIKSIGVAASKVNSFRYWLDLSLFKPTNKSLAKKRLKIANKFTVFFVGRLIETKGVKVLLDSAKDKRLKDINFIFAGIGPLAQELEQTSKKYSNIKYIGQLSPREVKYYMNAANLVAMPSLVDEGYGRVAMEAIACGTPVLAAKKGGLSEVVSAEVGKLIEPTVSEYTKNIIYFLKNHGELMRLSKNTQKYAKKTFSEKNVDQIINYYKV